MTMDAEAHVAEVEARFGLEAALGLVLAREVIQALGGRVWKEAHEGSARTLAFELVLPAAAEEAEPTRQAAPGRRSHILVVDDNATNRMVAQALCEMFDCTCEAAEDGQEAVEAARAGRFDLILMDIRMPNMDGVEAARAIRALPGAAGRVPIIALTANADPEDAQTYRAAGMNGVVEKPMKAEHLLVALREALDGGGAADQDVAVA
jgi:CheY-like chemotaxis protein